MANVKIETFVFMELKVTRENNSTRNLSEVILKIVKREQYFADTQEPQDERKFSFGQNQDDLKKYEEIFSYISRQIRPVCLISNLSDIDNISTMAKKDSNVLKLVHQNIRGNFLKRVKKIEQFLEENDIDIFCVTEHQLLEKDGNDFFDFDNYKLGSWFRRNKTTMGGSLIIIHKNCKFKERSDISVNFSTEEIIEIACVELEDIVVLCVYLPKSIYYNHFEPVMNRVLRKVCLLNKNVIVCGDFNINLFENTKKEIVSIKNLFKSYNLNLLFLEPTRVTEGNATCIDNIYTNILPESKQIIRILKSDHFGQLITFVNEEKNKVVRNITDNVNNCVDNWRLDKLRKQFPYVCTSNDPNKVCDSFFHIFGTEFISSETSGTIKDNEIKDRIQKQELKISEIFHRFSIDSKIIKSDKEVFIALDYFFGDIPFLEQQQLTITSAGEPAAEDPAVDLLKNLIEDCKNNLSFSHVTADVIIKTFHNLDHMMNSNMWAGSAVKDIIETEASNLALFYNNCIDNGKFPNLMKLERNQSLFKPSSTTDSSMFDPFAVLPVFIIFEIIIYDQLKSHFLENGLFSVDTSTVEDKLKMIVDTIFDAWEDKIQVFGIFCNFSKSRDWVNHNTLVSKLRHYGISGNTLDLLVSYLGKKIINGKMFYSILGSFLYRIYINDLALIKTLNSTIVLHADEISLLFQLNNKMQISDDTSMINDLSTVVNWFNVNKFKLNITNTRCILFVTSSRSKVVSSVRINETELIAVDNVSFLNITLDSELLWGPHLVNLANKLNAVVCMILRARQKNDVEMAKLLYFNRFHTLMCQGILLWGHVSTFKSRGPRARILGAFQTIFDLQKRAISAIYYLDCEEKVINKKIKELNILTVVSQFIYENLIFVKSNINEHPKYRDIHGYNTRNAEKHVVMWSRLQNIRSSYRCKRAVYFNKLPSSILGLDLDEFKCKVKEQLCKKFYCSISSYENDEVDWD
ncbi:hypothetical protein PYW07_014161 [Mythimna separata]|uniref:Endonuclease/exonuclease/phosphatase domain-containing protein n=1 Tax=Mythimna separata TaxID=271217 RepID=A0AAD7Z1F5_MYTSE|nr:hypothetical protein PYW07_014161 [Mythimna separata]